MIDSLRMNALYYPFHLCHEKTLNCLLIDYGVVHFRDYMALQLTPLLGTTAFPDQMGDYYLDLLKAGKIVQGHNVSGPMNQEMISSVDRDLADPLWRSTFHNALKNDYRFQRGLFDVSQLQKPGNSEFQASSVLLEYMKPDWMDKPYRVKMVKALCGTLGSKENDLSFEYAFALLKTSAALVYTVRLCNQMNLVAATDSASHHQLLARTCERDGIALANVCVKREGY